MNLNNLLFLLCMITCTIESSYDGFNFCGTKRKAESYSRGPRKLARLDTIQQEFITQVNHEKIDDAIDVLSDIASEGFLTPELTIQIDNFIDFRKSSSPYPEVFTPIKRHLAWLVKINSID